jgi:hypothetical protein
VRVHLAGEAQDDLAAMARTAVAATHRGRLVIAGRRPEDVGYVDDGGEPILIQHGGGRIRPRAGLPVGAGCQERTRVARRPAAPHAPR